MKRISRNFFGLVGGAILMAVGNSGCDKTEKPASQIPSTPEANTAKAADSPTPTPKSEASPVDQSSATTSADEGGIAKQINGYWAPDKESLIRTMKQSVGAQSGEAELTDPNVLAMLNQRAEQMSRAMAARFENGKILLLAPGQTDNAQSYKIVTADEATGEFTMETTQANGTVEESSGKIQGDTVSMTTNGRTLVLSRIEADEFEKRKEGLKNATPAAGNPPLPVPPLPK